MDSELASYRLNRHEFEQTPGDGEGQGSLACCSPWGCKELDVAVGLNNNYNKIAFLFPFKKLSWQSRIFRGGFLGDI